MLMIPFDLEKNKINLDTILGLGASSHVLHLNEHETNTPYVTRTDIRAYKETE